MNTTERELLERCKRLLYDDYYTDAVLIRRDIETYLAKPAQIDSESILIDGVAYMLPMPVAIELFRLNLELQQLKSKPVQKTKVWDADGYDALCQQLSGKAKPVQEPSCNQHPDAPHGFSRNASHSANRYVCECEGWSEKENIQQEPVQEPVGTVRQTNGCTYVEWNHIPPEDGTVCYAAPQSREPMSEDEILEAIARGWCHAKNSHKTMDIDLVSAIAYEVYHAIKAHHSIK